MNYEDQLRDRLINLIVVMFAIISITGIVSTNIRAMQIGWYIRDLIQILLVVSVICLALFHRHLSTHFKAVSMILIFLTIGIIGYYTLGMFAGGVYFFPLTAIIISLFYSTRTVVIFLALSTLYILLIAYGYTSGHIKLTQSVELQTNAAHWSVYIICFLTFLIISSVTILSYRRIIGQLINKVSQQRDDYEQVNNELQNALNEVKVLRGILPICSFCKKVRDDKGNWEQLDVYITKHSDTNISHGVCPDCMIKYYPEEYSGLSSDEEN